MTDYFYIDSADDLAQIRDACRNVDVIAVDTEFARFNTYYPIVGLIQIYTGHACFLVDPLSIGDMAGLAEVLTRPNLLKVFHACSEDMEVFQHALGVTPAPVHDTQIAGAVLGVGFSLGYQALVEHYLGISLPKDQTRSDWLARPLSGEQLDYAALDVIHLLQVYHKQAAALAGTAKENWVRAESENLGADIPTMVDPEITYLKLKGLWQFNRVELNQLKALFAWREAKARSEDVPRNRVADQKALMTTVKQSLSTRHALQHEASMTPRQVRKYGDDILLIREEAGLVPEKDCPPRISREDVPVSSSKLKQLKKIVEARARELSIAPEMLAKRRHLEALLRSGETGRYELPKELTGWRKEAVGHDLLGVLGDS